MTKIIRSDCFIMRDGEMPFQPRAVTMEINGNEIEFRALDLKIKADLRLLKELIEECAVVGGTYLKEDKENRSVIRYTKGIPHTAAKHVTVSLSHTDDRGEEEYMITAEATELDRYLRRKMRK